MLGFKSGLLGPGLKAAAGQSGIYKVQKEEAAGRGPRRCLQTSAGILCQTARDQHTKHSGRRHQRPPRQHLSMQTVLPGQLSHEQQKDDSWAQRGVLRTTHFMRMWENVSSFYSICFLKIDPYSIRL